MLFSFPFFFPSVCRIHGFFFRRRRRQSGSHITSGPPPSLPQSGPNPTPSSSSSSFFRRGPPFPHKTQLQCRERGGEWPGLSFILENATLVRPYPPPSLESRRWALCRDLCGERRDQEGTLSREKFVAQLLGRDAANFHFLPREKDPLPNMKILINYSF